MAFQLPTSPLRSKKFHGYFDLKASDKSCSLAEVAFVRREMCGVSIMLAGKGSCLVRSTDRGGNHVYSSR